MTRAERVKICETCKHCQKDIERGFLCGLTNEYADFDDKCHLYEPSEKQLEETRAKRVVARMKAMTRIGLSSYPYAFGIGVYFFIVACLGFTISEDYGPIITCLFLLSTGFVLAMVIGADYYFLRYKRKRKIFGELTSSAIEQIIKIEGFYPQKRDGIIYFKSNGQIYEIYHDAPKLSLVYRFIYDGTYNVACGIAIEIQDTIICGKISLTRLPDEPQKVGVTLSIETLTHFTDELELNFARYLQILNDMAVLFNDKYRERTSKRDCEDVSCRRNGIYCPEYYFIPQMIDNIYNGRLAMEALTDEEWLRQNIRIYCMEHDGKEFIKEWDDFKIQSVNTYGDYKLIIYAFPQPKEISEALYGAVLLNMETHQAHYYTLEYSYNNKWVLGSMDANGEHNNYGTVDSPDLDKFIAWIFEFNTQTNVLCGLRTQYKEKS